MTTKAVVLISGGLDSVYNLYESNKVWPGQVRALFFNYGQKAFESEKKAAHFFTSALQIPLETLDLSSIFKWSENSLTSIHQSIPTDQVNIESEQASIESARQVWVANRNGVLLNVAAAYAESINAPYIIPGFNREEAATFADNSVEYIQKMNECFKLSTRNQVEIRCFSQDMNKNQIISHAHALGADLEQIWSCYFSADKMCGNCESCQRFLRAFESLKKEKSF